MTETPVRFGPEDARLMGVLTVPDALPAAPLACLLINQGAGHRTGPARINVKLARRLAQQGIASLRLDLAGLGDSDAPRGNGGHVEQGVADLLAAMQLVETMTGIRRFLHIGLCMGGVYGAALAQQDPRVAGLLLFDSFAFPRRRAALALALRRIVALPFNASLREKIANALRGRIHGRGAQLADAPTPEDHAQRFRAAMSALAARGTPVLMLSSGSLHVADRGHDQLGEMAGEPFAQHIEYRFEPAIEHTLVTLASQRVFLDLACDWARRVQQRTAVAPAGAAAGRAARPAPALAGC
ncbi:alpha/beta fold hydrolase [Xenophilus azovorans]|uniref:alpha/beta fold hydrolase n=1 Tax=Xenophilus TaxID=151754 RepID=UPI000692000F|nr:alpha/beta fold hydrolase [Xenophilus azovorans]